MTEDEILENFKVSRQTFLFKYKIATSVQKANAWPTLAVSDATQEGPDRPLSAGGTCVERNKVLADDVFGYYD